jgi:hypothetical protein
LRDPLLFFGCKQNQGAILRAGVRALTVPLGRIVGQGK